MTRAPGRRIAENRAAHDRLLAGYDARHPEIFNEVEQGRLRAAVARAVSAIRSGTPAAERVMLDVGAGTGNLTSHLLAHPGRVIACDLSEGMLRLLARRVPAPERVATMVLNGTDLRPQPDASADLIAAYSVLHHVPDYVLLVRDMARVVRPGGVILIEHEKAPAYWTSSDALRRFFSEAVVWPAKRWTRFVDPRSYWRRIAPHLVWQRWFDRRWMPEGDIHIWPEDHIEWGPIEAALAETGCEVVVRDDHLAYEPRFRRDVWERYRTQVADTRSFLARRVA